MAFPWYSSAGGGSGPGELIGVKVETLDTSPNRQTAVEQRQGQPGLFGWQTTHPSAREVWPLRHTHTHICTCTHTHTHQSPPLLRLSSLPRHLMPWLCTSPPGSPLCPSLLDTPTCHWSSSPCWSRLSESLSGWEETSLDRCHTTLLGSSPPRGAISSGEEESCLGNCKATRIWLPWELRSCPGMFILCIQLILFYFCERICCVYVYISEAVCSVSSAHVTALAGVHLGESHWGGGFPSCCIHILLPNPPPFELYQALFISR